MEPKLVAIRAIDNGVAMPVWDGGSGIRRVKPAPTNNLSLYRRL